jgi:hypothetical protein
VILVVPAIVALALWAFAWPAARTAPNDLPVGVAGPPAAAEPVAEQLRQRDGAFDVHTYADEASAREAVADREVYGAIVVSGGGAAPGLLTASAAGPVVAGLLEEMAAGMAPDGERVAVTDVVPTPEADPRGAVFNSSVLPLALAGIATGAVVTVTGMVALHRRLALAGIVGAAVMVGLAGTWIGHSWLEVLNGNWWAEAGVLALTVVACAATVAGFSAFLGSPGIGVGALVVMLMGNPWSGATSAPEMLPDPVGVIGQWLPLGAGATLLRSVAFFDGAAAGQPLLVLGLWTLLGVAAIAVGRGRRAARRAADAAGAAA